MKRKFFCALVVAALGVLAAQAQLSDVTARWAKTLDTTVPDMGIDFTLNGDALYYLSDAGSSIGNGGTGFNNVEFDPTMSVYYDGNKIATGAPYEGSSYNHNLSLIKTDLDGKFLWTVYSTSGEIMSNNGGVAPAPDGGVYVSVLVRHTDNLRTSPLIIVDGKGTEHTIDWRLDAADAKRYVRGLVMRVSAEGTIDWLRLVDVSTDGAVAEGEDPFFVGQGLYFSGLDSDRDGNLYLSGRYVSAMTLPGTDGDLVLTPHNVEGWDGDSQKSRGDLFVAKWNAEGYVTGTLTTTGVAEVETSPVLAHAQNDLVLNAIIVGNNAQGSTLTLGGKDVVLANDRHAMVTARIDRDLNVKWVQVFACADKIIDRTPVLQNNHVNVVEDDLWITGMGNFDMTCGEHRIATATSGTREGFAIKCNAVDGTVLAATVQRASGAAVTGINGFLGGFENEAGTDFYTYGYSFGGQGIFLCDFDAETLEYKDIVSLVTGGSQPTAQECLAAGNVLYTVSRGRTIPNFDITFLHPLGSDLSLETKNWASLHCAFTLPFNVKEDELPPALKGDVNGDGQVNGSDVTALYEVILNNKEVAGNPDVNGDGNVNGTDVTVLYNLLLN